MKRIQKLIFALRRRSICDAVTIAGICLMTYIFAESTNIFDRTYEFAKRHEYYEVDDLIVVAVIFGALMLIYALRRAQDLKLEANKREIELQRREESFRLLFDSSPVAMWLFDLETLRFLAVNDVAVATYGWSREQFLTMKVTETRAGDEAAAEAYIRALPEIQNDEYVGQHKRADGTLFSVGVCSRIMNYEGRRARLAAISDITGRMEAENALSRLKAFLDTVIENIPMPIIVKTADQSRFSLINKAGEELLGLGRGEIIGKTPRDIFGDERANRILAQDAESVASEQPLIIPDHTVNTTKQGVRLLNSKKVTIQGPDGKPEYILTLVDDVTERRRAERRIAHLAHSDSLTDLPNRAAFNEHINATLRLAELEHRSFAILCMDLDGFKGVNDVYGHSVGDSLLCQVADRLRTTAVGTFVARLGGDEFIIVADIGDRADVVQLTKRLLTAFLDEFDVDGHRLTQALSIGVAIYPIDGTDAKTIVSNADAALYQAKTENSGFVQFFKPEIAIRLHDRATLRNDLKIAIQRNELRLHYQPQRKITGEITGFEALARWNSPKRGMVPPSEFIPAAEESGLILSLDEWALIEGCREAASWGNPLNIAVNISPVQFRHGDIARLVHSVLLKTGLAANRLELEITEGVLIGDLSRAISILFKLKSLGVRIAMDDFGTGYSSLSYLRAFPFDRIKIDRSFISDLRSHHSTAIVHAVIGLGRSLNIPILAEGVETQAQHAFLAKEGCNEVQGYLTGRPLEIAEYADVVGRPALAPKESMSALGT